VDDRRSTEAEKICRPKQMMLPLAQAVGTGRRPKKPPLNAEACIKTAPPQVEVLGQIVATSAGCLNRQNKRIRQWA